MMREMILTSWWSVSMSADKNYDIRLASYQDIQLMLTWAQKENWNPGLNDAFAFQLIDPNGFFMGYLDDEPVSSVSAVKYSDDYAFIGLYIVNPAHRGKGLGYKIWQHALQYAKLCSIGLDGVLEEQKNYNKDGFQIAHRNIRYALSQAISPMNDDHLIPAQEIPLAKIFEYDRRIFLYPRNAFLTAWLLMPNVNALIYYDDEKIKGYGVIRECGTGYKVGPLFADNYEVAAILFQGLSQTVKKKDQSLFLDIPEPNSEAKKLVQDFKMTPVFEVARMYRGQAPALSLDCIFSMTTFEIG
jgi:GNAT superfamily N-acetyltransferase